VDMRGWVLGGEVAGKGFLRARPCFQEKREGAQGIWFWQFSDGQT
jgi:hypothetical protein